MEDTEQPQSGANSHHSTRRGFLIKTSAVAFSASVIGSESAAAHEIEQYTIRDGTPEQTTVYVTEENRSGPTVFVIGGQHGDEPSGWMAANEIAQWQPDTGRLVVIPEADQTAIRDRTYTGDNGNLNRAWTIGSDPTRLLAREIWDVVEEHDPDVFFDLHSSFGIYGSDWGPDGVGQAVHPTPHDYALRLASAAATYINRNFIPDHYRNEYNFQRGPFSAGDIPTFTGKVAVDLEKPGFTVESTRYEVPLDRRVTWTRRVVTDVLRHRDVI